MQAVASLAEVLIRRVESGAGGGLVYVFLGDGETEEERITFAELDRAARALAVRLGGAAARGDRALLLFPPGIEFAKAFFGCLYAGVTAVPTYPPTPQRLAASVARIAATALDCRPSVVLASAEVAAHREALASLAPALRDVPVVTFGDVDPAGATRWTHPEFARDAVALLQYTSGSTGDPRGVVLTHGNIVANQAVISAGMRLSAASTCVGWLPLYHDMGLIGNLLQAVYQGYCCVLMSPLDFLKRPASWLRAITRYRATVSGAPNFAYELCTRRIADAEREGLDLRSWEVAFCGAEPVRAETLDRFVGAFAPAGFRRSSFYPCYGLAEATLMVTGAVEGRAPSVLAVDREALAHGRAEEVPPDASGAQRLVGCGVASERHEVRIVDPDTCRPVGEDAVGEIWVRGPSVAQGYWERPALSAAQFGARLDGVPFLRTGDLGFVHGGELFVAGRIKDVLVLKGRKIHPHDVERIVDEAHPAVRRGCGAAFAVEADAEERLALVQEIDPGRATDVAAVMEAIRRAVSRELSVQTWAVALVPPGSVAKTSSGKVRRAACRQRFLEDGFETIAAWRAGPS